jgi:hypothetical protein
VTVSKLSTALLLGALAAACGSSPTAAPQPTPTPTPKPSPTPNLLPGCGLAPLPDLHNQCPQLRPEYYGAVDDAIKATFKEHPELFDFTVVKGGGIYSFKVLDRRKYTGAVVEKLHSYGYCAVDQKEEIAVKKTQVFNEQYNIWTSDGFVRLPPGAYETTCFPAQF